MKTPIHFFNQRRQIISVLALVIMAIVLFGPIAVNTALAQIPIDPLCFGDVSGTYNNWAARFLDGGKFCDVDGEEHGGTSGADGVDAMDFDGDCDVDIITGWEETGKVFIYLNPTFSTRPAATCPTKLYPDNTEERTGAIINQWPLLEVKRDGHPNAPFSGVEDAIFADNDGDDVADYVVIATEAGRMDMFVSFITPDGKWHTFDLKDGDEYFMRAVVGDIDGQGCPDILGGSKTVEDPNPTTPNRTGDIRWWRCLAGWTPELWKTGAPLPDYGNQSEMGYFKDLWGGRNMMNTQIKWIMEMNIVNLVPGSNPNSTTDYPEILFTDRRKVGYMYLVDPAKLDKEEGWEFISIDDPGGSDFRWYWLGQLIDDDGDNDYSIDDPNDPPEIVATYNGDQENGVFARWYQRGNPVTITVNGVPINTYSWLRNDVVLNGRFLPWGYDTSHPEANRTNKAAGIADVDGDGHPEIIATIRGSYFSGAFYLKPESGLEPPSCNVNNCNPDGQEWLVGRISPHYPDNIKFDNLALVDADLDCDIDVFTVEENGVGDKGLGTVWYENTLEQGSANAAVCNNPPTLSDPVVLPVDGGSNDEGKLFNARLTFSDPDINDAFTCTVNYGLGEQNGTISLLDPTDPTTHQCIGPDHLYRDNGTFLVTMTVSDGIISQTRVTNAIVFNVAPIVEIPVVSPSPADINQTITAVASFSDPAGNLDEPFSCTVDYGSGPEGGTINNQTCSGPAHAYDDEGDYTITFAVTDKDGDTGSRSTTLIVTNLPPVVSVPVISPSPSNEGGSINASATFSDGALNGPYTCSVDYGDGGSQAGTVNGYTCDAPAHTYDDNGSYTVTISVADGDGDTGDGSAGHQVNNVAPTATFTLSPTEIFVGESAYAAFSNAFDPSTADTTAGFTYSYDCDGDGSWDASSLGLDNYICLYPNSGAFTVKGQISDKDGGATVYSAVITVLSPQQALQTLIDDLNALKDAGVINQGQAISLIVKLQNAISSLNAGNTTSAVNKIQAFTNQVEGFINGGNLTLEEGQPLLDKAQHIIDAIQLSV